ncbi:MAG: ACP S-malonyltransferase [Okeania sp. SIO2H7]|nr:ACP S-malonyltransferase [Okeania sp. SIO2H7]
MTKIAWVFPGQGSQEVGMGLDLLDLQTAKTKFELAEKILGWSIIETCQSDKEKLSRTLYTQPCLFVIESILAAEMQQNSQQPIVVAGHSLGEYVALHVAGVFDFETGLKLVKRRAELMDTVSEGKMVALIGFKRDILEGVIDQTPNVVLANDNSPVQVVISGTTEGVETVLSQVKAKKKVELNVSGAFHSHLMNPVAGEFNEVLEKVDFAEAKIPVLSNVEPTATTDAAALKKRLLQQMTKGVRWREISLQLPELGIEKVVEIGPGKVLTGLMKKTCSGLELENINSLEKIEN